MASTARRGRTGGARLPARPRAAPASTGCRAPAGSGAPRAARPARPRARAVAAAAHAGAGTRADVTACGLRSPDLDAVLGRAHDRGVVGEPVGRAKRLEVRDRS